MKKKLFVLLIVLMVLFVVSIPALADSTDNLWRYTPYLVEEKIAGNNFFITTYEEAEWFGIFNGISTEEGKVKFNTRTGAWSYKALIKFDGTVDGKSGTLNISVNGRIESGAIEWFGYWVILNGTGDLANLHGQGTWWGPGAAEWEKPGDIYYDGNYHFEP